MTKPDYSPGISAKSWLIFSIHVLQVSFPVRVLQPLASVPQTIINTWHKMGHLLGLGRLRSLMAGRSEYMTKDGGFALTSPRA
jgi:hypothetical protein